jgi:bifunctional DNA primase/polymerase-like protein
METIGDPITTAADATRPEASAGLDLPPELPSALAPYLRRGWPILPLLPGAKAPAGRLVPDGVDDASADPVVATAWWLSLPAAGVGVALAPAGLLVIGPDSPAWLVEFERLGLPDTAVAESRPGHRHYYYRRPAGCRLHRLCKSGEYDILTNGYVVAPPSIHPRHRPTLPLAHAARHPARAARGPRLGGRVADDGQRREQG